MVFAYLLGQLPCVPAWIYAAAIGALIFANVTYERYLRPKGLRDVPGPFWASVTNLHRLLVTWGRKPHEYHVALHRRYGPLVRLGPNVVSVAGDPDSVAAIYGINRGFIKSNFYPVQRHMARGKPTESMFSTTSEKFHASIRRPVAHAYSMSTLMDYEPLVDSTSEVLVGRLKQLYADPGLTCDLGEWLQWYAFDVIGEMTFSRRLGFLERAEDVSGIITSIERDLNYWAVVGQMPWTDWWMRKNPVLQSFISHTSAIVTFGREQIQQRLASGRNDLENNKGTKDFLSKFLDVREKSKVPEQFVMSWTNSNMFAGAHTTGISLRSIFYFLLNNPLCLEKLRSEIDAATSHPVSWKDTRNMPYLEACIKEAMRMHPAAGLPLERIVPEEGLHLDGITIPAGTIVGISPWVMHRNTEVYGEDVDVYRPERWVEASEDQRKLMDKCFLTFGSGPRLCLGKNISLLEMHKVVPEILNQFDIELTHPGREWKTHNAWFVTQSGLDVTLRRRKACLGVTN